MLKGNLTCTIISKLLTHYVEDNLDDKCKNMVSIHLRNCPMCMEKYTVVKKLFMEAEKKRKLIKEKEKMQEEISAYLDGEMSEQEIADFEQKLSKKEGYEDALIQTMNLKKTLNNSFYKTKYNLKTDIAAKTMQQLKNSRGIIYGVVNLIRWFFKKSREE